MCKEQGWDGSVAGKPLVAMSCQDGTCLFLAAPVASHRSLAHGHDAFSFLDDVEELALLAFPDDRLTGIVGDLPREGHRTSALG